MIYLSIEEDMGIGNKMGMWSIATIDKINYKLREKTMDSMPR